MKIIYMGCVQFSYALLKHLLKLKGIDVIGIVTRQSSLFNADFKSLQPIALEQEIPCYLDKGNDQVKIASWIKALCPDVIYCFGWSYLLKKAIIENSQFGVIGYHPAALPFNRGRHPIIWALALGLTETASTFFFMDGGADSGDILHQEFIKIKKNEDASVIYEKLLAKAKQQMTFFSEQLISGNFRRIPQDHTKANYWRKRSKEDGQIDWRMSAVSIYNLVRALTKPYAGAHCVYNKSEIKIWKTEKIYSGIYTNIEPGKILESGNNTILVKCGDAEIRVMEHEFSKLPQKGEYL